MSSADDYRAAVAKLRGWGFTVVEVDGCYSRSNGGGWSAGRPVGHINHHYVCSLNPDQDYIDQMVQMLVDGDTVHWFADVHGVAYLVGAAGPMNHAGTGNSSVLNLTKGDRPPPSFPAGAAGDISGNPHYSGTECQHPGDDTPWPEPMLDVMVAINAAEFLVWGYTENRAIDHAEWSNRKIDMSAWGGVSNGAYAGAELRRRVAAQMTGGGTPPPTDWWDELSDAEKDQLLADVAAIKADVAYVRSQVNPYPGYGDDPGPYEYRTVIDGMASRVYETNNVHLRPVKGYGEDEAYYPFEQAFESLTVRMVDVQKAVNEDGQPIETPAEAAAADV